MPRPLSVARLAGAAGLALTLAASPALAEDWALATLGSWNTDSNWSPMTVPNGVGASASFISTVQGGPISSTGTVTFTSPVTVGSLHVDMGFAGPSIYFNPSTLTLDNGGGADVSIFTNATLNVQISGQIVLMGDLVADWRASNGQISASISGDYGIVTNSGYPSAAARLRLWGNNTYTGQTTAINGDISIQTMAGLGDHAVGTRIEGDSTLIMENLSPITLTGEVVTLADGGSIFTRPCNWAETVIIENRGRIGPWFDDYEMTVSGQITGTGVFVRRSAISRSGNVELEGIVTLTNPANDYTGGTEINAGILRVFDDAVLGVAGTPITFDVDGFDEGPPVLLTAADVTIPRNINMVDNGWLRAEAGTTGTYTGVISGSKTMDIGYLGWTGTVALEGDNTYTGVTTVRVGTLLANNTTGSATGIGDINVLDGATFGGTGSVSGAVNSTSGTIAPGASAGMLHVGGLSLDAASIFDIEIGGGNPGEFDELVSSGDVALAGTINASVINAYPLTEGEEFAIITAPSITGTFDTENIGPEFEIEYNPTSVILRALAITPPCPSDLNGDSAIDGADLAGLLAAWGAGSGPADLNGDNVVDGADLAALLAAWGACP
jgi:autotransporter-associated beta strand protein